MSLSSRTSLLLFCVGIFLVAGLGAWVLLRKPKPIPPPREGPQVQPLGPTLEMREIDGSVVPFQNGWPYPTGDRQKRPELSLNGAWKKFRVPGNHTMSLAARDTSVVEALRRESLEAVDPSFDDGGWTSCNVPSVENPAPDRYQDVTWYRKSFRAPADWKGRKVLLHFGAANYVADVWLNGEWLGCHEGGFTPFCFEISSKLDPAGNNVLAVRVDNIPWRPLNSDDQFKGKPGEILPYKTADWWNYGGLLRDVRLESLPSVAAMRAEIRPSKESPDGSLDVALVVRNSEARAVPTEVRWAIYPARWSSDQLTTPFAQDVARLDQLVPVPPGSAAKVELPPEGFAVAHAQLPASALEVWNLRNPVLYVLEARVMVQGQVQDTFYAQFGRRRVQSEDGRILLNGSPVFFRGVAQHEIFPGSGEAPETVDTGEAIVRQDFQNIWDLNANFVRTGHHPPHPLAPIAADRLGIALWEEIPAYWFDGASFDYQMKVRGVARQMFEELIARDFNRPSILFWGTCNECGGQKERAGFIRDLKEVASKTDGTRLVMQSAAGSDPVDKTQAECDAVGFTSYFGVFYGWPYGSATVKALEAMHAAQPKKALIATEFGIWSESDWSNIETQMLVARETWGALTSKPYVAGATWWALNDWHTMISDPQSMGLLTVDRRRKATYYVLQDLYGKRQGEAALRWSSPMQDRPIRGTVPLKWEMVSSSSGKKFSAELDGKELAPFPETTDRVFVSAINTDRLKEGEHVLTVRAENQDGLVLSQERVLFVDNVDEPPTLKVNLKDGDEILPNHLVRLRAEDDRSLKSVEVQIDDAPARTVSAYNTAGLYLDKLLFDKPSSEPHRVVFRALDDGGQKAEIKVRIKERHASQTPLKLPFDTDWISGKEKYDDGVGFDYPSEELPESGQRFVFNSKTGPIEFVFGDKAPGRKNCLEAHGQTIQLPAGHYRAVHLIGSMHDGSSPTEFTLAYADGLPKKILLSFSDWWKGQARYGEEVVIETSVHHEKPGPKKPGTGIYLQSIPLEDRNAVSLRLPNDPRVRIFAVTLEP